MNSLFRAPAPALAFAVALSFLSGAAAVFGEIDDAPGLILIAMVVTIAAFFFALRSRGAGRVRTATEPSLPDKPPQPGTMEPRITLITLGVDDLHRALAFYRDGLGFPTEGIVGEEFENGAVVFVELQAGIGLALWPRKSMAADAGIPIGPRSATEFTLAHNVADREEVHAVMAHAEAAGARIVKAPDDTFYGGYAGYFQDPDGHLWEIAWNPSLPIGKEGGGGVD